MKLFRSNFILFPPAETTSALLRLGDARASGDNQSRVSDREYESERVERERRLQVFDQEKWGAISIQMLP